jgi:hypothetical protein
MLEPKPHGAIAEGPLPVRMRMSGDLVKHQR